MISISKFWSSTKTKMVKLISAISKSLSLSAISKAGNALIGLLLVALYAPSVLSDPISEHDRQDMALQKALDLCMDRGGAFSWSMPQRFRLVDDPQGYRIIGNELLIVCVVRNAAPKPITLRWTHPTKRADGTDLGLSEIAGYNLFLDGRKMVIPVVNEYVVENVAPGIHTFQIQTIDKNNLLSDLSGSVSVTR